MTRGALQKMAKIKISSPVIATQLESYLLHVYQNGQLTDKVDEKKIKKIMDVLSVKR